MRRELPSLGRRGEGWFALQVVLMLAVALAPPADRPAALLTSMAGVGVIVGAGGILLVLRGFADLGTSITPFPRPRDGAELVEGGIYRYVRHPIYGGVMAGAIGWSLVRASTLGLLLSAVLAVFFELKSRREEAWLAERYGNYDAYRRRTRKFLPLVY